MELGAMFIRIVDNYMKTDGSRKGKVNQEETLENILKRSES